MKRSAAVPWRAGEAEKERKGRREREREREASLAHGETDTVQNCSNISLSTLVPLQL